MEDRERESERVRQKELSSTRRIVDDDVRKENIKDWAGCIWLDEKANSGTCMCESP